VKYSVFIWAVNVTTLSS